MGKMQKKAKKTANAQKNCQSDFKYFAEFEKIQES